MNYPAETFSFLTCVTNYLHCTFTSQQEHISSNDTVHYHELKYNMEKIYQMARQTYRQEDSRGESGK